MLRSTALDTNQDGGVGAVISVPEPNQGFQDRRKKKWVLEAGVENGQEQENP